MKSIRWRLIFWISVLFIFIGLLIYLPLSVILPQKITSQIVKRDVEIANYLSNQVKSLILLDDKISLSILLYDNLQRLEDAQYLFVQAPTGEIISHTFTGGFPKGLLSFNSDKKHPHSVQAFLNEGRRLYDIAIPISKGELGVFHLGVSLESGKKDIAEISRINHYVAIIILVGLGIGIFVFLCIGFLFSNQIIKLKNFASTVGRGDLDAKIDIKSKDEIGELAFSFNEMVERLKEKIHEVKRLNTIQERNKIAFDLHDGCVQDLANIIKRIELSERLFKIDPEKAFLELKDLKETTKDILNETRRVIFSLKSYQDLDFNLADSLNRYIENYKKDSDIKVKWDIHVPLGKIPKDRSKAIFYIITEALTNVRKHAQAKNLELSLKTNDNTNLEINIKDDGRGFDVSEAGKSFSNLGRLGLVSMRERTSLLGGAFNITSELQKGTRVSIDIPLN